MIDWLRGMDAAVFRWINLSLANGFFDWLMPRASDPPYGVAVILALLVWLAWKGGARGRLCIAMFLLALCFGNWMVVDTLKHAIGRPRPFYDILEARLLVGRSDSFSMPSSHAANWFSAAFIGFIYYRRSVYWLLPAAALVGFSRIYNGVHYPSDVLAGAVIGAGYAAGVVWSLNAVWQWAGPRWFAGWHRRLPSLIAARVNYNIATGDGDEGQWLRFGYVLAALVFVVGLIFLAAGGLELSEDEAYQWIWSKHLALSYYSKPPMIAYTQFLGTHLWGDNEFGVRFFSPVIAFVISILLLRFMAKIADGRAAFALFLICATTPLFAVGSVVMTIDPLSVMFWIAAMIIGWRAVQPDGRTRDWLWMALWIGLGFLSKYTNLFQVVCLAVYFCLWPPSRAQLRKPGPWLALLIVIICMAPVVVWNAQRHWVTVTHVAADGQLEKTWKLHVQEFIPQEAGVLHPVYFVGAIWAAIAFWRRGRRDPLQLYLFSMGAPLFLLFFLLSWHSRVLLNWIVPSVAPMFCLMVIYWRQRWSGARNWLRPTLALGIGIGAVAIVLAHAPRLIEKLLHHSLPAHLDPLRRVHGWKEMAALVEGEREKLAAEGKPAIMIGGHYGITGEETFYLPAAKARVPDDPLVFCYAAKEPQNQFYFWRNYLDQKGGNAIFYREASRPKLKPDWLARWWRHDDDLYLPDKDEIHPLPPEITAQFQSVTRLGLRDVMHDGKLINRVELFACRGLR
jgi:membrane-associated phospholipid phosphatase